MAHELLRIEQSLSNVPHLVHPATFEVILNYFNKRKLSDFEPEARRRDDGDDSSLYSFNEDSAVAIMNISGPLSYRPVTVFGMDCGGASYQRLKEDFTYLVDSGAKTIALNIDSGGGEAYQCFATGQYMRNLANEAGVKIITFVDGHACSAAYALASIADEVIVAEGAEVGSIGVLVRLMNDSKALEQSGLERTFITAGKEKIPYANDGSFRKEFLEDIQEKVDGLYSEFAQFVSTNRNLSVEDVIATEAKTFTPEKAIQLGLVDKVMTVEGFYDYLSELSLERNDNKMLSKNKLFKLNKNKETPEMDTDELSASLEASQKELADVKLSKTEVEAQLAGLKESLTSKEAELSALMEKVAQLEKEKVETKMSSRLTALRGVVAEDKAESMNASLASLADDDFKTVLGGLGTAKATAEASELFNEMGGSGATLSVDTTTQASASEKTKEKINQLLRK